MTWARALALLSVAIGAWQLGPVPSAGAESATVTPLLTKALEGAPDREVEMITVEYAPGVVDPIHRHHAQAFVYVLEGTIEMQVAGGEKVTLTPGQTFYEGPDDLHVVGRNVSRTEPAKLVVVLVKKKGAPVLVPEPGSGAP